VKYVLLHGEGIADDPHQNLGGKTPLEAAATPNMEALAHLGELGKVTIQADGLVPNSDVAALAFLGYDPRKSYPGPAPFEAAGLGIRLGEHDVVFRCNMVTLRPEASKEIRATPDIKKLGPAVVMDDATGGGLDDEEARELIDAINEQLGSETIQFYAGSGHRHLMVWVSGKARASCVNPNDIAGRPVGQYLPAGDGSDILRKLMEASLVILRDHPVNDQRREAGLKPAHCVWLWGQGRSPNLLSLTERYHLAGAVISASDVHRGIGISAGLEAVDREVLLQDGRADFSRQGEAALRELEKRDFIYLHAQMPPEVIQDHDPKIKLKAVEEFDRKIVGTMVDGLKKHSAYRLLLVCDRTMPGGTPPGTASSAMYVIADGGRKEKPTGRGVSDSGAGSANPGIRDVTKLIMRLLQRG
jgi:2,3-bisphosphoglycerate-independent phosphoglycerate mutase